ncbi:Uncharacterised protein [Canicola haemoglobinophilus]|uniref:Uncharacterized protein n=1 Tax=Canicola haemoglobinophilus TaxID=733 RepID=A0A377HWL1_9PAST|nr:Uncharacterised protein [Canicola haemoglobinophilus]
MVEHIFELSNRYHLKLSNRGYVLYQLALNEKRRLEKRQGVNL